MSKSLCIKEILHKKELKKSATVIKKSFIPVAKRLNLNKKNALTNPAFMTKDKLYELQKKGLKLFGLFKNNKQIGFVVIEKAADGVFYLEKLSVLPEYRHHGYGKLLIDYVFDYSRNHSGKKVSIGVIDENTILKNWYQGYDFIQTSKKKFSHLPFIVCFMEKKFK